MQKKFLKILSFSFTVFFISLFGLIALKSSIAAWTGPTAPPPGSNTLAPIDVSLSNQTKLGGLTLGKDLYLESGLRLLSNGGSNYGYLVNIADTLTYNTLTNGVEVKRFTIGNDGNVAIGDVVPTAKLHIAGDIKATGKIYSQGLEVLTSGNVVVSPNSVGSLEVIDGSLTSADVNTGSIQTRVTGTCAAGSSIRTIAQDGTVVCEPDDTGASYTAGAGISIVGNTISATGGTYTAGAGISISGNTISAAVASETDPTVPANIKDGVDWSEISGIPADFADGVDDVAAAGGGGIIETYVVQAHTGGGSVWWAVSCKNPNDIVTGVGGAQGGTNARATCVNIINNGNTCDGYFADNAYIICGRR